MSTKSTLLNVGITTETLKHFITEYTSLQEYNKTSLLKHIIFIKSNFTIHCLTNILAKERNLKRFLAYISLAIIFSFVLYSFDGLSLKNFLDVKLEIEETCSSYPVICKGFFCILYVIIVSASIPLATVLSIFSGILFGVFQGALLSTLSATCGAIFCFILVRYFLKSFLHNQNTQSFDTFQKMIIKNGVFYLFAIRMIPVFPFYLVNVFMAFTPIKVLPYGLVTLIGIAPMTIAYVYFGSQINKIHHVSEILSPKILVIFCLLGLIPLILRYAFNYFFKK